MDALNTGSQTPEETPAPDGHNQAMIDKVDQKEQELQQGHQETPPEKILGKFETQADLEKAYQALEKKLSEGSESDPKQPAEGDDKATGDMNEDKASELISKANVNIDAIAEHFYANNELTEDHYTELEKAGIPKAYVDQYISGVQAEGEQMREALMSEVGGEESFQAISQWALANLSEQELSAYNQTMDTGDMEAVRSSVMSLAYRYEKANGKNPQLLGGQGVGTAVVGFESVAQLTEAMKDPRYHRDPAYRKGIEDKLARSNIL